MARAAAGRAAMARAAAGRAAMARAAAGRAGRAAAARGDLRGVDDRVLRRPLIRAL
jgi:hypothetical protein